MVLKPSHSCAQFCRALAAACGASCTYDNSPDEDFIIDTLPAHDNTLIITGLSGHGFKFASVLGEIAANFAQDKPSDFDLTPFRLSRFK
jgi:N-methyl-L-tryptophan oxidase